MTFALEVKQTLRKLEFPRSLNEALAKIEHYLIAQASSLKHMDLSMDLMVEFVFFEKDRRGNRITANLPAMKELQIVKILLDYFGNPATPPSVKNTMFLSLFGSSTLASRMGFLSRLVSLAMCTGNTGALLATGVWMQQLGNVSNFSLQLARSLVTDYFTFKSHREIESSVTRFKGYSTTSTQFVANFFTAVSEIYFSNKRNNIQPPPAILLETVTKWISDNPKLCLATQNAKSSLPAGAIPMAAMSPLSGLLKWCILAPMYSILFPLDQKRMTDECLELYGSLHLSLLNCLSESDNGTGPPTAICAEHFSGVLPLLHMQIRELEMMGKKLSRERSVQLALERLAQAVQVAMTSNCIYGNLQILLDQMDKLPENRLLKIVIIRHKETNV